MPNVNSGKAKTALVFGHMAGMIDLASLPVWVGTLIAGFHYAPAQAGGLVTLFLVGVVVVSAVVSSNFRRLPVRWLPPFGFAAGALAFFLLSRAEGFTAFAVLHFLCGLAVGTALSVTHGTMGRTENPHRIFAIASAGFGIFAMIFLGGAPVLIAANGPSTLFLIFAGVMLVAAIATGLLFPHVTDEDRTFVGETVAGHSKAGFGLGVWFVIAGVVGMNLNQAMVFSFLERIGIDRGFGTDRVQLVLIALGFMNLFPALIAAAVEKRFAPISVGMAGALLQALLAIGISTSPLFPGYAVPAMFYAFVMLFSHTFLFGYLARIEPTGRAVAATPAMTMSGSALAPLIGGILVETVGYPGIGMAVTVSSLIILTLFGLAARRARTLAYN